MKSSPTKTTCISNLKTNPFFYFSLASKELFHSNFLAWLWELDENIQIDEENKFDCKNENISIGRCLLIDFLCSTAKISFNDKSKVCLENIIKSLQKTCSYYEIKRERGNIDLTIEIWEGCKTETETETYEVVKKKKKKNESKLGSDEDDKKRKSPTYIIYIELKVKSLPNLDQLDKYYNKLKSKKVLPNCEKTFILLTLNDLPNNIQGLLGTKAWLHIKLRDFIKKAEEIKCFNVKSENELYSKFIEYYKDYYNLITDLKALVDNEFCRLPIDLKYGIYFDDYTKIRIGDMMQKYYASLLVNEITTRISCLSYCDDWLKADDSKWNISHGLGGYAKNYSISIFRRIDKTNRFFGIQIEGNQFRIFIEIRGMTKTDIKTNLASLTSGIIPTFKHLNSDSLWVNSTKLPCTISFPSLTPSSLTPNLVLNHKTPFDYYSFSHFIYLFFSINSGATIADMISNIDCLIKHADSNISNITRDLRLI